MKRDLKLQFETRMREMIHNHKGALKYPRKFVQMVIDETAVGAAVHLFQNGVRDGGYPRHDGFADALFAGRLDLTVEWVVWAEPKWQAIPEFKIYLSYLNTLASQVGFQKLATA